MTFYGTLCHSTLISFASFNETKQSICTPATNYLIPLVHFETKSTMWQYCFQTGNNVYAGCSMHWKQSNYKFWKEETFSAHYPVIVSQNSKLQIIVRPDSHDSAQLNTSCTVCFWIPFTDTVFYVQVRRDRKVEWG